VCLRRCNCFSGLGVNRSSPTRLAKCCQQQVHGQLRCATHRFDPVLQTHYRKPDEHRAMALASPHCNSTCTKSRSIRPGVAPLLRQPQQQQRSVSAHAHALSAAHPGSRSLGHWQQLLSLASAQTLQCPEAQYAQQQLAATVVAPGQTAAGTQVRCVAQRRRRSCPASDASTLCLLDAAVGVARLVHALYAADVTYRTCCSSQDMVDA
jgi:hypothetical protein